jgi:hypothetical protein
MVRIVPELRVAALELFRILGADEGVAGGEELGVVDPYSPDADRGILRLQRDVPAGTIPDVAWDRPLQRIAFRPDVVMLVRHVVRAVPPPVDPAWCVATYVQPHVVVGPDEEELIGSWPFQQDALEQLVGSLAYDLVAALHVLIVVAHRSLLALFSRAVVGTGFTRTSVGEPDVLLVKTRV